MRKDGELGLREGAFVGRWEGGEALTALILFRGAGKNENVSEVLGGNRGTVEQEVGLTRCECARSSRRVVTWWTAGCIYVPMHLELHNLDFRQNCLLMGRSFEEDTIIV